MLKMLVNVTSVETLTGCVTDIAVGLHRSSAEIFKIFVALGHKELNTEAGQIGSFFSNLNVKIKLNAAFCIEGVHKLCAEEGALYSTSHRNISLNLDVFLRDIGDVEGIAFGLGT